MTITSGFEHPRHRTPAMATEPVEPVELVFEPLGVDDPGVAHGGRSRRVPAPPALDGLVARVRAPATLPTKVRRVPQGRS